MAKHPSIFEEEEKRIAARVEEIRASRYRNSTPILADVVQTLKDSLEWPPDYGVAAISAACWRLRPEQSKYLCGVIVSMFEQDLSDME